MSVFLGFSGGLLSDPRGNVGVGKEHRLVARDGGNI
jgi:hypothetical protein